MKESKEQNFPPFEKIQSGRYYDTYLVVVPEGSTREEMYEFVRKEIGAELGIRQSWPYKYRGPNGWYVEVCTD